MAQQLSVDSPYENSNITNTIQLLEEGEQRIVLKEQLRNLTLIVGNTGAGKTTFVQWIAGNNDRLFAKEVAERSGEFIIVDENRIGNSTIQSATLFPELVIDSENNTTFYDCPGYSDTRSSSHEIAITYFIKKVLDHSENVKFVFIVNYSSVRKGVDRQDFIKLIRHSTNMIKDVEKFMKSIAIVVTKVDNQFIKVGRQYNLVSDEKVIETIAEFLREVKIGLIERLEEVNISVKDRTFYENTIKFVDILLTKKGEIYTKIGIFRRPDESGVLSNITLLQEGKIHIKKILYESLEFTAKDNDDFGYTISDRARNDIKGLVTEIYNNLEVNINNMVQKIKVHCHNFVEKILSKIESVVISTDVVYVTQYETELFLSQLNELNVIYTLIEDVKNLNNIQLLVEKLKCGLNNTYVHTNSYKNIISNISNQGNYFEFLQIVSNGELTIRSWEILFQNFLTYISVSQRNIQNDIIVSGEKIQNKMHSIIKFLTTEIRNHYHKKMELFEIQKLRNEIQKGHSAMLNITRTFENLHDIQKISKQIGCNIAMLDIKDSKIRNAVSSLSQQDKYRQFLQFLSRSQLHDLSAHWINSFQEVRNYLYDSEKWYIFLDDLHAKFSVYRIQENTSKYNVANVEDWGLSNKPQGLLITRNNFHHFLEKIIQYNITEYDAVKAIEVSEFRLQEINNIIRLTLQSGIKVQCPEPHKLVITGEYIKFSDFIKTNSKLEDLCGNRAVIKSVNIFALNTIFIDRNFEAVGQRLTVSVIAPQWEVVDSKKINLDGSPGATHSPNKASDGSYAGERGDDGVPGLPGGTAGSFLGIGREFVNGENLTISANGGKGGPGQDGGNGAHGENGKEPPSPSGCGENFHYRQTNYQSDSDIHFLYRTKEKWRTYTAYGTNGGQGGDGGDGGTGGIGGNPGNVALYSLGNNSGINSILRNTGRNGESGNGGLGLPGGQNGKGFELICETTTDYLAYFIPVTSTYPIQTRRIEHNYEVSAGKNGTTGSNTSTIGQVSPDPTLIVEVRVINDYKSYLRENLNNRFTRNSLQHLFQQLNTNCKVNDLYDTLRLVDELQSIEDQVHKLNKEDIIDTYQFLLNRIHVAQSNVNYENSGQHKKVQSYLYTSILTRLYNENKESVSNLDTDISKYLDLIRENIKMLANLEDESNKINVINEYKNNYRANIDREISEANNYIETYIKHGVHNIGIEVNDEIDMLINKTMNLQDRVTENKSEFINQKEKSVHAFELGKSLKGKSLFDVLKSAGDVVILLGPIGRTVCSVIETSSSITESLVLDNSARQTETFQLPSDVTEELQRIKEQVEIIVCQKFDNFNKLLREIHQETDNIPHILNEASITIADINRRLATMRDEEMCDSDTIRGLEDELKQELKRIEGKLRNETGIVNESTSNALTVIGRSLRALRLGAMSFDTYVTYKNDEKKLKIISDAIKQADIEIQELQEYEEIIYDAINSVLKIMKNDLNDTSSTLNTNGKVVLDVTNGQVQSFLKNIRITLRQAIQSCEVQNNVLQYAEELEESMTTFINIYDRIQNYKEQQNLSAYIAYTSSSAARSIHISDTQLSTSLYNLDILIRSDLILAQYNTAIAAFQQWMFPFAYVYLSDIALGSHLNSDITNTLHHLVCETEDRIERMKSLIENFKLSVQHRGQNMHQGELSSHFANTNAFFVWENRKYKNMISKLLSGEKVIAKANIINSPSDKDSIKFNIIGIYFRSGNTTIQSEIYNKLKNFKVSATHLGNSYYRYNNKFYVITGNSQNIQYSIERDHNGDPIHSNDVYNKIKDGDCMLSPYAMWEFQLMNSEGGTPFHELMMYKDGVSLELVGHGNYISGKFDLHAENYYRIDDTVYEMNKYEWQESGPTISELPTNNTRTRKRRSVEKRGLKTNVVRRSSTIGNFPSQPSNTTTKAKSTSGKSSFINHLCSFYTTIFGNCTRSIDMKTDVTSPDNHILSHNSKHGNAKTDTHNLQELTTFGDVRQNFIFGQLIAGMIFGKNKSLGISSYISPENQRNMEIHELARNVLPILEMYEESYDEEHEN